MFLEWQLNIFEDRKTECKSFNTFSLNLQGIHHMDKLS